MISKYNYKNIIKISMSLIKELLTIINEFITDKLFETI